MPRKLVFSILVTVICILSLSCGAISIQTSAGYYPPFIKAAQQGNIKEAQTLLQSGVLVNEKTIGNQTALHVAAAEGQDEMVRWLLAHEANPLAQDQNGKTPADYAKSQGHPQTGQIILDYIQLLKDEQQAINTGDIGALQRLLSQDGREYTVLHIMVEIGSTQRVADEISAGANVNARTLNGITPLHKCVVSRKIEICQLLLNAGADVNARDIYNNTPLYYAISFGNKDMVKLFLDSGADPSIRSIWGNETALDFAKREGDAEIIALLEQK